MGACGQDGLGKPWFVDAHTVPCYPKPSRRRRLTYARWVAAAYAVPRRARSSARLASGLPKERRGPGPMDRFVSNVTSRLDAKGRVSIPAPFRAVLARDGFEGLYVHPALDAPALDAGGNTLMAEIEAFLLGFSPYSEERDRLATA